MILEEGRAAGASRKVPGIQELAQPSCPRVSTSGEVLLVLNDLGMLGPHSQKSYPLPCVNSHCYAVSVVTKHPIGMHH